MDFTSTPQTLLQALLLSNTKNVSLAYISCWDTEQGCSRVRAVQDGTLLLFWAPKRRPCACFKDAHAKFKSLFI
jgi:hypothetical protein